MTLDEQNLKKFKRQYYCGRPKDYFRSSAVFKDYLFLTTNFCYATWYAKQDGVVVQYVLNKNLNIFNAKCRQDFNSIKFLIDEKTLDSLKSHDWSFVLGGDESREKLVNVLKSKGYDGFFNYEYDRDMQSSLKSYYPIDSAPAVCLFNESNVSVVRTFNELKDFMQNDSFKSLHKREMNEAANAFNSLYDSGFTDTNKLESYLIKTNFLSLTQADIHSIVTKDYLIEQNNSFYKKIFEESKKYGHSKNMYNRGYLTV